MLDPIFDNPIEFHDEEFELGSVERAGRASDGTQKFPSRHYAQSSITFDNELLSHALAKLGIGPLKKVTVFGGYTGQFALALKGIGADVLFTDPMKVWCEQATMRGFKAITQTAEEIQGTVIAESDAMATFECYMPFANDRLAIFTALRFLTTKYGIIFAESDFTRTQMKNEAFADSSRLKQTPSMLNYLKKAYGLESHFASAGGYRVYRFSVPEKKKAEVATDLLIMRKMHDESPDGVHIGVAEIQAVADNCHLSYQEAFADMMRLAFVSEWRKKYFLPKEVTDILLGEFWIGVKSFDMSMFVLD